MKTTGDNYNIKCPFCGKFNHYVCNRTPIKNTIVQIKKECFHCKNIVYYYASLEIMLEAYDHDKLEGLSKLVGLSKRESGDKEEKI